jgi:hypothetical protein
MITVVGSVLAGLAALVAGLFGLGLGLGALMLVLLPLLALALIPLVPVLLVVALLRRLAIVRGRLASFAAVLIGLLLLGVGAELGWGGRLTALHHWLDDNRKQMQICKLHGRSVTVLRDQDGVHISCGLNRGRTRPSPPPEDANI